MRIKFGVLSVVFLIVLVCALPQQFAFSADTLVNYPFTGDSLAPTELAAGVIASNFAVSAGDILFGTLHSDSWTGSGVPYAYSPNGWDAGEWTEGKYFYFTVTPAVPGTLIVEEMDFLYRVPPWDSAPTKLTVAVGDDEIFTVDPLEPFETRSFSVDGLGLAITEETTFKIVGWGALEPGGELRVDDVRLRGSLEECLPAEGFPEGFDDFDVGVRPPGWEFIGIGDTDVFTEAGWFGESSPALRFGHEDQQAVSRTFANPLTLSFWLRGGGTDVSTFFLVEEYYEGARWEPVEEFHGSVPEGEQVYDLDISSTRVRFTYVLGPGEIALDDVDICRLPITPTPPPHPRIEVEPHSLHVTLLTGETTTRDLLLKNTGLADLNYSITFRAVAPSPPPTPIPTPTPEDFEPTPTPEDIEPTPTPEDFEPTPTPDDEAPTPTPQYFTLTIEIVEEGGAEGDVVQDPLPDPEGYPDGTEVELTAVYDDEEVEFDGWTGDITTTENPTSIEMIDDRSVTATFRPRFGEDALIARDDSVEKKDPWHEGVLRIKLSPEARRDVQVSTEPSGVKALGIPTLDALNRQYHATKIEMVFPTDPRHAARHRRWGLDRWYQIRFEKAPRVPEAVAAYKADPNVEIAEPVYRKRLHWLPDDTRFGEQWHYRNVGQTGGTPGADIRLEEAWEIEKGKPYVVVQVVDTGIDVAHPDLAPNLWVNPDPDPFLNDIHGWNFANHNNNIQDTHGHGTHVAGTVAAVTNNALGVAGVAGGSGTGDGARIMVARVFGDGGLQGGFAPALVYGADNGAVISQNSWGYTSPGDFPEVMRTAIDYFIAEAGDYPGSPVRGGVVVFAAGNDNDDGEWYPAYYEPVIAVAATDHNDQKAWYSNYGPWVDISAPGGNTVVATNQGVLSTVVGGYGFLQGTSMAAPHVSGVAALLASHLTGLPNETVKNFMINSADRIDSVNPDYAGMLGSGRLNAYRALRLLVDVDWLDADPRSGTITPGEEETVTVFFDSTGYAAGTYSAEIVISSNDPASPEVVVPASMTVLPPPSPTPPPPVVGPISGWVYDGQTFRGIPDVRVTASGLGGLNWAGYAETDSGGFFRITDLKRGNYEIKAIPKAKSPYLPRTVVHPVPTGSEDVNIMLARLRRGFIQGRVFDRDTGAPLEGFRVYARDRYEAKEDEEDEPGRIDGGMAYTNAQGYYRIDDLHHLGHYQMTAQPVKGTFRAEYAPLRLDGYFFIDSSGVDFAMPKGGAIYGRVTDELTGQGVPDINLTGYDAIGTITHDITDAAGNFRLSPLSPGRHIIAVRANFHNMRHDICYLSQWYYQRHWVDPPGTAEEITAARAAADRIKLGPAQELRKDVILVRCPFNTPTPVPVPSPTPPPSDDPDDYLHIWQIWSGVPGAPSAGDGQATLIKNPATGLSVLYECGIRPVPETDDLPREALYLMDQLGMGRGDLDYIIISHYHFDHYMGVPALIDGVGGDPPVPELVREGIGRPAVAAYDRGGSFRADGVAIDQRYLDAIGDRRQTWWVGGEIDLEMPRGDAIIKCLAIGNAQETPPGSGDTVVHVFNRPDLPGRGYENALSLVVNLMYGAFDMYLGGDSSSEIGGQAPVEEEVGGVIRDDLNRRVDVLLVNHHGSANQTSSRFLDLISPTLAVISTRPNFPHPDAVGRLEEYFQRLLGDEIAGRQLILQTALHRGRHSDYAFNADAHIHIRTDGNFYTVESYDVPGRTTNRREFIDRWLINHPANPFPLPTPEPEEFSPVISQIATEGPGGAQDFFVEIYNPVGENIDVSNWQIQYGPDGAATGGVNWSTRVTINPGTILPSYYYMLFTHPTAYTREVPGDQAMRALAVAATGGHIRLLDGSGIEQDRVGWRSATAPKGRPIPGFHGSAGSYLRKVLWDSTEATMSPGGRDYDFGNLYDTDDNARDFVIMGAYRRPRNLRDAVGPYPHPPGPSPTPYVRQYREWNLPAGGTYINGLNFDQYLSIYNPVAENPAPVEIDFVGPNGLLTTISRTVPPLSRVTVKVNDHVGNFQPAVSTLVRALSDNVDVICERSMYWSPDGVRWAGGHNSVGIARAETDWYLAEGATHSFDMFVHVLNPSFDAQNIDVVFVNENGQSWNYNRTVPARSNWTIDVKSKVGSQSQISTRVSAELPIAVERTMYWNSNGIEWVDGHASRGASAPRVSWQLPEGATHIFDEYVLAANFAQQSSRVRFTFMDGEGDTAFHTRTLDPMVRYTVRVADIVGNRDQVSTIVSSDDNVPIVAERAMYWNPGGVRWGGGHASVGTPRSALKWHLAEGATHIFDQYVLVANPNRFFTAEVRVIFNDAFGNSWTYDVNLEPLARHTVKANNVAGTIGQLSTVVESLNRIPIVAERAMYWNAGGVRWSSGHGTVGFGGR